MALHSPTSAIIFNALIIVGLIPLALRGVRYKPSRCDAVAVADTSHHTVRRPRRAADRYRRCGAQQRQHLLNVAAQVFEPAVCTQPVPAFTRRPRTYCTTWCARRAPHLRRKGLLPGGPGLLFPQRHEQRLGPPKTRRL